LFSHTETKASVAVAVAAVAAVACVLGALAAPAGAKTIHVRAKHDGALGRAIDRANAGDRLVVHKGTYSEAVVIDKRLRIVGRKKKGHKHGRKPVIDAGCGPFTGVDVTAESATLRRLKIRGGDEYTLDTSFVERATARQLRLIDECDAEYGINVYNGGAIQILDNRASGYSDAGIYVGGITNTQGDTLLVEGNDSFGNNRGLIVEDSYLSTSRIRVADNRFHDNTLAGVGDPSGIFVHNSDHVTFVDNAAQANGLYGIDLDSNSDLNRLFNNTFTGNPVPVRDQGGDNCGSGNAPNVFPAC
jgi:parallel beta-helix repeat protein